MMKKFVTTLFLTMFCSVCVMAQNVEVKYFHGKQRCITCRSIEKYTQEVLQESYATELKDGKIKYSVIDYTSDGGKKIAKDYHVTFSSLYVVKGKRRVNLTEMGFKYAKSQPAEFKKQLKEAIDKALKK